MPSDKILRLDKERKQVLEESQRQRDALEKETARDRTHGRFVGTTSNVQDAIAAETYGLVQLDEFQAKKRAITEQLARQAAQTSDLKDGAVKRRKKEKSKQKAALSFADDEEADQVLPAKKKAKVTHSKSNFGKDPSVNTSFLPDKEREEIDRKEREVLRQKWLLLQEELKLENIDIVYSYFDGRAHRETVTVQQGDTIATFLDKAKQQWPELKGVAVDNLMYIKDDLIIPHHYTFYEFLVTAARGKTGVLFKKDPLEEAANEQIAKIVERSWYARNQHIFPASRWDVYTHSGS